MMSETILVTGAAGFIGSAISSRLLNDGFSVVGVDNVSDYYDPALKLARLDRLQSAPAFDFHKQDIANAGALEDIFRACRPARVIHLAAQPGVRYSIENPAAYVQSNLVGHANVLECCRRYEPGHLVFASSSSVYGLNRALPFSTAHRTDHQASFYGATKKAAEVMSHSYADLYGIPSTGLRFFTVYGPWGRPDMSPIIFANAISRGLPIQVFNRGKMARDFTYIDDIVEGIRRVVDNPPSSNADWAGERDDPAGSRAPFRLYNIGNHTPIELERFIDVMAEAIGKPAIRDYQPMAQGDVERTCADVSDLQRDVGFAPDTPVESGLARFAEWYRDYYANQHG